jgi:hypothetical protein
MHRTNILLAIAALLIASLACVTIMGEGPSSEPGLPEILEPDEPFEDVPTEQPFTETLSCSTITDEIIDVNMYGETTEFAEGEEEDLGLRDEDTETYIASYIVSGDEITDVNLEDVPADLQDEQDDLDSHERIWNYYTSLIPAGDRETLAEFWIFTDGPDNVLAAVGQTYDDPYLWTLEVDITDSSDYRYLTFTLVHEFAHLLTLGPDQVPPDQAVFDNPEDDDLYIERLSACSTFFTGEGCANEDSYIYQFHQAFWTYIYDEWNEINLEEDDDIYYERLDEFYDRYQDQFLTDYSVTHPAEDIAESFAFFVFSRQPDGDSIAEEKILFFYQFPELVELRNRIASNVCEFYPQ